MKRFVLALCTLAATALMTPWIHAQELSSEDREKAVRYLEKTRDDLIAATKGLSQAQWDFKADTNRWSIADIAEHLAATEDLLMQRIRDEIMKAPARTEAEDLKALDAMVIERVTDRSNKAQAPEPLRPTRRFGSPQESLKHFQESREKTIAFVKNTKDLRAHATDSPLGKKLDAYQWLLFAGAHCERHLKQLNEVKSSPGYPKS